MLRLTILSFSCARPLSLLPRVLDRMTARLSVFFFGASSAVSLRALCRRTSGHAATRMPSSLQLVVD